MKLTYSPVFEDRPTNKEHVMLSLLLILSGCGKIEPKGHINEYPSDHDVLPYGRQAISYFVSWPFSIEIGLRKL